MFAEAEPDEFVERFYILGADRELIEASQAEWMSASHDDWRVAETTLPGGGQVSTYFTGDGETWGDEPALPFQTLSLFGDDGLIEDRYPSWKEAEAGHAEVVQRPTRLVGGEPHEPPPTL